MAQRISTDFRYTSEYANKAPLGGRLRDLARFLAEAVAYDEQIHVRAQEAVDGFFGRADDGLEKEYQEEDGGWGDEKQPIVLALLHQPLGPPSAEKPYITHVLRQDCLRNAPAPTV